MTAFALVSGDAVSRSRAKSLESRKAVHSRHTEMQVGRQFCVLVADSLFQSCQEKLLRLTEGDATAQAAAKIQRDEKIMEAIKWHILNTPTAQKPKSFAK